VLRQSGALRRSRPQGQVRSQRAAAKNRKPLPRAQHATASPSSWTAQEPSALSHVPRLPEASSTDATGEDLATRPETSSDQRGLIVLRHRQRLQATTSAKRPQHPVWSTPATGATSTDRPASMSSPCAEKLGDRRAARSSSLGDFSSAASPRSKIHALTKPAPMYHRRPLHPACHNGSRTWGSQGLAQPRTALADDRRRHAPPHPARAPGRQPLPSIGELHPAVRPQHTRAQLGEARSHHHAPGPRSTAGVEDRQRTSPTPPAASSRGRWTNGHRRPHGRPIPCDGGQPDSAEHGGVIFQFKWATQNAHKRKNERAHCPGSSPDTIVRRHRSPYLPPSVT